MSNASAAAFFAAAARKTFSFVRMRERERELVKLKCTFGRKLNPRKAKPFVCKH